MIKSKFKISLYAWRVYFLEIESKKDWRFVVKFMKEFKVPKSDAEKIVANIKRGCHDGGEHFYTTERKMSLIILYRMTSVKKRIDIICHEKRHLEDRVLDNCKIYDIEAAAYLAGYVGKKLFSIK